MRPIKLNTIELGVEKIITFLSPEGEAYSKAPQIPECSIISETGIPLLTESGKFILCEKSTARRFATRQVNKTQTK